MKAYYSTAYGGPEVSFYGDFPDPSAGPGQVLVEVKSVSINPVDIKVKRGDLKILTGSKFPRIYGSDFAGIVRETDSSVTKFKSGDRIYGVSPVIFKLPGALAELLAVDQKYVTIIPEGMSFDEAAALPTAALTALNGLRNCRITGGKHILINGATGGVGHYAVQIAKAKGAVITATCRPENAELALRLGADDTIGYSREDLAKTSKKYDAILDAFGKMDLEDVCRLLRRKGIYASTIPRPSMIFTTLLVQLFFGKKLTSSNVRSRPEDIQEIEKLFFDKKLNPLIENIFPLDRAGEAFELAEYGKPRGKVIVKI